ncbi:MAG: hypothetical protein HQL22_04735 [Candidatus Omnitrophica bacterium]|nr:hypothetical protein [Candidatus Omnitrophota bacterium]
MKKIALAVVVLMSFASLSYAQAPVSAAAKAAPAAVAAPVVKAVAGKVELVVVADPAKGTMSSIEIVNEKGQKALFSVSAATVITDAAGKPVALGALANGAEVKVAYDVAKDGNHQAVSIKLVK